MKVVVFYSLAVFGIVYLVAVNLTPGHFQETCYCFETATAAKAATGEENCYVKVAYVEKAETTERLNECGKPTGILAQGTNFVLKLLSYVDLGK